MRMRMRMRMRKRAPPRKEGGAARAGANPLEAAACLFVENAESATPRNAYRLLDGLGYSDLRPGGRKTRGRNLRKGLVRRRFRVGPPPRCVETLSGGFRVPVAGSVTRRNLVNELGLKVEV